MENRLKKYDVNVEKLTGGKMDELDELTKLLKKARGYQLTVSIMDRNGRLDHRLMTKEFPSVDMLRSHVKTKELIVEDLERINLEEK